MGLLLQTTPSWSSGKKQNATRGGTRASISRDPPGRNATQAFGLRPQAAAAGYRELQPNCHDTVSIAGIHIGSRSSGLVRRREETSSCHTDRFTATAATVSSTAAGMVLVTATVTVSVPVPGAAPWSYCFRHGFSSISRDPQAEMPHEPSDSGQNKMSAWVRHPGIHQPGPPQGQMPPGSNAPWVSPTIASGLTMGTRRSGKPGPRQ